MVITRDSKVWTKSDGPKESVPWVNHLHEEADNRMIAHIADIMRGNMEIKTICVRTADNDVIAILTCCMTQFKTMRQDVELWVIFGTCNNWRIIFINMTLDVLGDSISQALPFFHAFTGCHSTCSFFRKTKPI